MMSQESTHRSSIHLGEAFKPLALSRMGREATQGEIGVVSDGKYYGITQYAEE